MEDPDALCSGVESQLSSQKRKPPRKLQSPIYKVSRFDKKQKTHQQCAKQPKHGGHTSESFSSAPLAALRIQAEGKTAEDEELSAVDAVSPVDNETKGSPPPKAHEEVEWVVHEGKGKGDQPDKANDH